MTTMLGGKPNPGTQPDHRLEENAAEIECPPGMVPDPTGDGCVPGTAEAAIQCPPGMMPDPSGDGCVPGTAAAAGDHEHFTAERAALATDAPWNGSASRFSDAQYQAAAAACGPASEGTVKERCFLPHHEPGGALNSNGVHSAAGRLSSLSGKSPAVVARAKSHLRSHYSQLNEEPPDSIAAALELTAEETAALAAENAIGVIRAAAAGVDGAQWRGILVVEGVPTGDGREFGIDSVDWPDPSEVTMPIQWQKESSHGGSHDVTVAVGRIDRIWREPLSVERDGQTIAANAIWGEGRFDTHTDAIEAQRRMGADMLNGTSVNADDISDSDVEYIWAEGDPESEADPEMDIIDLLFGQPIKMVFHSARLRATTLCDIPAFVEATLHVVGEGEPASTIVASASPPRRAVPVHESAVSHDVWHGAEQEGRLRSAMRPELARAAYAYVEHDSDADVAQTACRFLHHEIDVSGNPGPANMSACLAGIQVVHGSRIPDEDKEAVYRHLAAHLRDAGEEPPPYEPQHSLAAHAWQEDMWRPPAAWFTDPEIKNATPIMVSNAGQVYGLATEWGQCHLGFSNECVLPPREEYHDRFMTGEQPLDNGRSIPVGQITAGIGHAPLSMGANRAAEHYDNTDAVVADVVVGNCRAGIWVAGAVRPSAQAARVQALRASGQVSPDWRRIGGQLRMVALLTVNVSGYQVPRVRTRVASGQIQSMVASGLVSVHVGPREDELDQRALRLQMEALDRRVHGR
jgi:hypothetical protein